MRVVIAPDKFKGCLPAREVAVAMARGVRAVDPDIEIEQIPLADGGEGTVEALVAATGGRLISRRVMGPLPEMKVDATFGVLGDGRTAVIEMAAASGLHLLRAEQYDPMKTTTYGTGDLIMAAVELGVTTIILGIGGSATVDGGIGCAQACGIDFGLDRPLSGRDLLESNPIPLNRWAVRGVEIMVACDVRNPLFGSNGAARVFGPQKGATAEQVEALDRGLAALAGRVERGAELAQVPGAGAAGGLGFGVMAFLGGRLVAGFELVAEALDLRRRLTGADLVITGEGRLDASSLSGKAVVGVARLCRELGLPCVAIVGSVGAGAERALDEGLSKYVVLREGTMSVEESMRRAPELLSRAAEDVIRDWRSAG